ncbi:DUF1330 domain-containing protein [Streptomyces sp. NPDC050743]|uniref:DUF1330 domain-containing protein n=1 Tax=Streptomyces sp. NPDC050743 TaxID=3365634 RepID=UPI0037B4CF11
MTAYVTAAVQVTGKTEELGEYRAKVVDTLKPYGGRYLSRGEPVEVLAGSWDPGQIVLMEFPDVESAQAWNGSAACQEIAQLRIRNTDTERLIVESV